MPSGLLQLGANQQEWGDNVIVLLTITHPATADIAYVSSDPTIRISADPDRYGTISRGHEYLFIPFDILLPDSHEGAPPQAQLTMSNVDRELITLIRSHHEPGRLLIELVFATAPGVIIRRFPILKLTNVSYDAASVVFEIRYRNWHAEAFPRYTFTPGNFPGLFP